MIGFLLIIAAYIVFSYLSVRLITKSVHHLNRYVRLLILSFSYALLWAPGIAASGGDPGFAFPAPNLAALVLMASTGVYRGVVSGLIILLFWWVVIFGVMFTRQWISTSKRPSVQSH